MSGLGNNMAWLLPFSLLAMAIVAVPLRVFDEQGLSRYRELKRELSEIDALNERLQREVGDLDRDVRLLRTDPAAIERIARDELGMIREGEIVFQFDE
jgi:cell division protein FtsB